MTRWQVSLPHSFPASLQCRWMCFGVLASACRAHMVPATGATTAAAAAAMARQTLARRALPQALTRCLLRMRARLQSQRQTRCGTLPRGLSSALRLTVHGRPGCCMSLLAGTTRVHACVRQRACAQRICMCACGSARAHSGLSCWLCCTRAQVIGCLTSLLPLCNGRLRGSRRWLV
jgi:hypothetical protein